LLQTSDILTEVACDYRESVSIKPRYFLRIPFHFNIQDNQKVSVHLSFLPHYLAQSDCLAADRQGQEDTRLTLTPSDIPNSNYVIMVSE
jgi:hypothetical protein